MTMMNVFVKAFGGLPRQYYLRQFLFGLVFPAFIVFMTSRQPHSMPFNLAALIVLNTFLYPYSRFVYESVVEYIVGQNVFWVNAVIMLILKLGTMLVCWGFAVFIAPFGLFYLYFRSR